MKTKEYLLGTIKTRMDAAITDIATWQKCTWRHYAGHALPSFCALCSARSEEILCANCLTYIEQQCRQAPDQCCDICDIPLPLTMTPPDIEHSHTCRGCIQHKPSYDMALTGLLYQFPTDYLINQLKHQRGFHWLPYLAKPLTDRIHHAYSHQSMTYSHQPMPNILCPVPSYWTKRLKRGYNQSLLIAQHLQKELSIPVFPEVYKKYSTHSQQGLSRKQRMKNLRGSFSCSKTIKGQHIALIDDVITTGATAQTIAKLLKQNGARRVDIWALARTPK